MIIRKIKIFIVVFVAMVVVVLGFRQYFQDSYSKLEGKLEDLKQTAQEIEQKVIAPPPLRSVKEHNDSVLGRSGVILWTNKQREQNGLLVLAENYKLNLSADAKVRDMFAKQYFEHVSPGGQSASNLAEDSGYDFLVIGENLALGNFKDDQDLVQEWMDSPGHRANILNNKYTEVGVAVGRGMFEGRMTWLAVQHFGRPAYLCPKPDPLLKQTLDSENIQLANLKMQLDTKKQELDNIQPKRGPEYNQKVDEYNALVNQYNRLLEQLKILTAQYNGQVNKYNLCLGN